MKATNKKFAKNVISCNVSEKQPKFRVHKRRIPDSNYQVSPLNEQDMHCNKTCTVWTQTLFFETLRCRRVKLAAS